MLYQVENALLAPTVVLANLEEKNGGLQNYGKIDAVQVEFGRRRRNLTDLSSGPDAKIVRNEIFTNPVYTGEMRPEVVKEAFTYIFEEGENRFFQEQYASLDGSSQDDGAMVAEHTYAPARYGRPVKLYC